MVLVAGSTSISDADDVTPRAIRAAGAEVVQFGSRWNGKPAAPRLPGREADRGSARCVRGRQRNAFDLVLPRLAAGERLTRHDLLASATGAARLAPMPFRGRAGSVRPPRRMVK